MNNFSLGTDFMSGNFGKCSSWLVYFEGAHEKGAGEIKVFAAVTLCYSDVPSKSNRLNF